MEKKIERKQSFFLNCNIQYPRPRNKKDVREKQEESGKRKKKRHTLWPLQKNVFFDCGDCGLHCILPRT